MNGGLKHALKAHMGEGPSSVVRLPQGDPSIHITIDGHDLKVSAGTTILEAALSNGIEIPHFCYHPGLGPEGNCRMCLVEIEGRPKLEPSCIIPVGEDMVVNTDSDEVVQARRGVMEFLLLNHPLDCPWCDKAGECMLQDNSYLHGPGRTRHRVVKRTLPVKDFSPHLKMYSNRCIQCTRCVRFLAEVEGGEEFSLFGRGADVDVGTYIEHNLTSDYQGCLSDVCPVGALVTKPFLYRARVFYLESTPSVCPMCSAGCSIYIDRYINRIVRLRPRPNLDVNDWWMCDTGRFGAGWIEEGRLAAPVSASSGKPATCDWDTALSEASRAISDADGGRLAGMVWAGASCEEVYLFSKLVRSHGGRLFPWYGTDGRLDPSAEVDFLRRRDPNPNTRGLEAVIPDLQDLSLLFDGVDSGDVTTLLVMGIITDEEIAGRLAKLERLVVISSHEFKIASTAEIILPGAVWAEKTGTFLNGDGHLQRFNRALDIESAARPELEILADLLQRCGLGPQSNEPATVYEELSRQSGPFTGVGWTQITPGGRRLGLNVPVPAIDDNGGEGAK